MYAYTQQLHYEHCASCLHSNNTRKKWTKNAEISSRRTNKTWKIIVTERSYSFMYIDDQAIIMIKSALYEAPDDDVMSKKPCKRKQTLKHHNKKHKRLRSKQQHFTPRLMYAAKSGVKLMNVRISTLLIYIYAT